MSVRPAEAARIGGLEPFSACDWPGKLVAVVFLAGCPWRCGYCHNPQLWRRRDGKTDWPALREWLQSRRGLLDGVVFSGGEPLAETALPALLAEVRALGFATGLHSGGAYPARLAEALPLLDWVGFDVKTEWDGYDALTGVPGSGHAARRSLELLLESGVAYECRTSIHPHWHNAAALARLADELAARGVRHYRWQAIRPPAPLPTPWPAGWPGNQQDIGLLFADFAFRQH